MAALCGRMLTAGTGGNQYLTGLTLYFVGYVIFEVCYGMYNSFVLGCG